ncbi:hypothetical protein SAMD00019534_045040 [Acytostelium subglobosum LB1]|uniref:hypothetical protein n=1 Tax=Acytostelium subglobosum LB1 TaxID=1410327 RepID=UPI000644F38E|nr:hypothetical protein SAMD00019534_045040 [Acytostelium subglobosum LB1]GAM21329.1 hypothetical protein SAMD00019534_045040 [Acytostelium subglobosum LB1]|eukprot:XP_012755448.1 hypothetical protein SAMD00019534_045040 [Acytostelium subglobosum LB1]
MEDRLQELKSAAGIKDKVPKKQSKSSSKRNEQQKDKESKQSKVDTLDKDIELGIQGDQDGIEEFMPEFFQEVGLIKTQMNSIRRNIKSLEEQYVQSLNTVMNMDGQSTSTSSSLIDSTNVSFTSLRHKLESLSTSNDKYAEMKTAKPTEIRIRSNIYTVLLQTSIDLLNKYTEVQKDYKTKCEDKITRQYKLEEIRAAVESGDSSKVFTDRLLYTHLHTEAKNALSYVQQRHRDLQRLGQSLVELHQLMLDMAILVKVQGEKLESIEQDINSAVKDTGEGVHKHLPKALKYQKKGRKKMYILLCIVTVGLIVIIVPVLSKLGIFTR